MNKDDYIYDSCPYWIGHRCFKDLVNKIKIETIDQCLSIVGEYDFSTYQDLKESLEELKNADVYFDFEHESEDGLNNSEKEEFVGRKIFDVNDLEVDDKISCDDEICDPGKERDNISKSDIAIQHEESGNETKLEKALRDQIQSNGTLCRKKISHSFNSDNNVLYLWTDIGFWKVQEKNDLFVLYHKNHYVQDIPFEEMSMGKYHRQTDLGATKSLGRIIKYIVDHDRAKAIMQDDYRNLPQTTKRQKMYYNRVKKKEKDKSIRRTDYLLQQLENGDFDEFRITI